MADPTPILATILRQPSPDAVCTCDHWPACDCGCHSRRCDPGEDICSTEFLPDDGGLAHWGCPRCTPGQEAPHYLGCELIGWNVPVAPRRHGPGHNHPWGAILA
jgi:hypothetical protein